MEFERQSDGRADSPAGPVHRYGHGPRANRRGPAGEALELRHGPVSGRFSRPSAERAGTQYGPLAGRPSNDTSDVSLRVIADHLRAMTCLIADGVVPSNEWRGYVLRKIMRRAMRHGKRLGLTEPFLHELTGVVIAGMAGAYPELETSREAIVAVVHREETQFDRVLRDGLPHLEAALADAESKQRVLDGEAAFRLYDTFGMPLDFIEDMAQSRSVDVDRAGFERAMEAQRTRARAGATFGGGPQSGGHGLRRSIHAHRDGRSALRPAAVSTATRGPPPEAASRICSAAT